MSARVVRAVLLITIVAAMTPAWAGTARNWSLSTAAQFSTGSLDGTALDADGRIRLAPDVETLWGPEQGIVWSVAAADDERAFVALSGPGRLLRVGPGGDAETWYRSEDEGLVTVVAPDGSGGAFFGVAPEGNLMHAAVAKQAESLVETGALFIWAVTRDDAGVVWIGTGAPGQLLRYERSLVTRIYESGDDPVRSIAAIPGGGVVFGTGGRGRVLRYDGKSGPFVLFDADEPEIVGVQVRRDGTVFALAASTAKQPSRGGAPAQPKASADETVRVTATAPGGNSGNGGANSNRPATERKTGQQFSASPGGSLYRIDAEGHAQRLWASAREVPFGLELDEHEQVLVSTGDSGRIVTVDDRGQEGFVMRIASKQASATARDARGRLIVGGTTDASVSRLGAGPRREGTYLTPALDATTTADWGRLSWEAAVPRGAEIQVHVRAGNSKEPDTTWTDWTELDGGTADSAVAELVTTRWFQARFTLRSSRRGESPTLGRVELIYLPRNRPPSIGSLEIHPPGVAWVHTPSQSAKQAGPKVANDPIAERVARSLRPKTRPQPVRKSYEPGARTVSWVVDDPDNDRLVYHLDIRREGDPRWLPLAFDLEERFHGWDARVMPDGHYRVRLTVTDSPDNPVEQQRSAELVSEVFRIDNSRPRLDRPSIEDRDGGYEVRFVARDDGGVVAAAEMALDGGAWQPLSPVDGLADSDEERFNVRVPAFGGRPEGVHALRIRVLDDAGNLGGASWALGQGPGQEPDE